MKPSEVYERVTQSIIKELEAGNPPPWVRPWRQGKRTGIVPVNATTSAPYHGINILALWAEREDKGYPRNEWLTYLQCATAGGQVRKGEKGTPVVYVSKVAKRDQQTEEERLIPFMKLFYVFNVSQCDGLPQTEPEPELPELERNEKAEAFFAAIGAETRWGEAMAAYIPSKDFMVMPARGAFHTPENMYSVWAHEHIHLTGHKSRLNRDLKPRFEEDAYAFEELVAELGAAMVCAHLQVTGELRHASYIDHWLKILKGDSRAILSAASLASKAADYLRAFSEKEAV